MIVKQISVMKSFANRKGEPCNMMLTADIKDNENVVVGILKLNYLLDSGSLCLSNEHNDLGEKKLPFQASKLCWARLRQVLIKKKGMKDDAEMMDYVKVKIGTDNLDWVSEEEVEQLISEINEE